MKKKKYINSNYNCTQALPDDLWSCVFYLQNLNPFNSNNPPWRLSKHPAMEIMQKLKDKTIQTRIFPHSHQRVSKSCSLTFLARLAHKPILISMHNCPKGHLNDTQLYTWDASSTIKRDSWWRQQTLPCVWEHGRTWPFLLCRTLILYELRSSTQLGCRSIGALRLTVVSLSEFKCLSHNDLKNRGLVCACNECTRHCLTATTQVDVILWRSSSVHSISAPVAPVGKCSSLGEITKPKAEARFWWQLISLNRIDCFSATSWLRNGKSGSKHTGGNCRVSIRKTAVMTKHRNKNTNATGEIMRVWNNHNGQSERKCLEPLWRKLLKTLFPLLKYNNKLFERGVSKICNETGLILQDLIKSISRFNTFIIHLFWWSALYKKIWLVKKNNLHQWTVSTGL